MRRELQKRDGPKWPAVASLSHPLLTVILAALTIFLLLLQIYHLSLFGKAIDYARFGDVATWFTGFMTFGAVAVALTESYRAGSRERRERDARATAVVPWLEIGQSSWLLKVDNRSGVVIEAWSIGLTDQNVHVCWRDAGPLPPGPTTLSLEHIANLPPLLSSNFPSYVFTFIDGSERTWQREASGRLTRSVENPTEFRNHTCTEEGK